MRAVKTTIGSMALLLGALLSGCDRVAVGDIQPGLSTTADLRAKMGEPYSIRQLDDAAGGGPRQIWTYPLGPEGTRTYFVHIAPDGRIERIDNVLTENHFARIQPGMTRAEVESVIGPHGREQRFALSPGEVTFKYKFTRQNEDLFFDVVYDVGSGRVKSTGYDEFSARRDSAR